MNTCPTCGKPIVSNARVCANCGFEVAKSETNQMRMDKIGPTDVRFFCPHCGTELVGDSREAGATYPCLKCGKDVQVPALSVEKGSDSPAEKTPPVSASPDGLHVRCKHCGAEHSFPDSSLGKLVQCSHCKKSFVVKTPEPLSPPLKVKIPKQTQPLEPPTEPENSDKDETAKPAPDESVEDNKRPSVMVFVKPAEPDISVEDAPGTTPPDSSAVLLEGVGQVKITVGWIVGIIFGIAIGAIVGGPVGKVAGLLVGLISVWNGYAQGAKEKATAKASINATKAAERTARMEQMLVNMVNQDSLSVGGAAQKSAAATMPVCPKCGTQLQTSSKFCPECGFSLRKQCEKCGTELSASSKFCPECGARQ